MNVPRHENAGQTHNISKNLIFFDNAQKLTYCEQQRSLNIICITVLFNFTSELPSHPTE